MMFEIFDKDIFQLLVVFSLSPGSKLTRNELKEKTKMLNVTLDNCLTTLINSSIIKKEKRMHSLNIDNSKQIIDMISKEYKKLNELPLNAFFSVVNMVYFLKNFKKLDIYLFGSYAKLIYKENSDIDIAIISDNFSQKNKKNLSRFVDKIEQRFTKKIEIHYFGTNFYKNTSDPLVKDILRNNVRLI